MISLKKYHNYYLTRKFATGGMAEIFRAWKVGEAGFEKQVVIKRMLTHLTTNEDFLSMFLSEARLVSRLTHANIVQVYDLGKDQEQSESLPTYFIAMEYVFGKNLSQTIKRARDLNQPLSWESMAAVILGAAQALEYAHALGDEQGRPLNIVHRDISPQNILIAYSGEIKLVDFGIAKALVHRQQTQSGVLKGKLSYMSPEQAMGEAVDQRSDIYSLGIVLWEMLTGHRLFTGDSEVGILQKVIKPQVASPLTFNPDIPHPLAQACMNCLQSDPRKRYDNAMGLIKDLNAYLQQVPGFTATMTLRAYMHTLFEQEMLSEKEQIQEELQAVRNALASPGLDSSATVVIATDGTLDISLGGARTTVLDPDSAQSPQSKTGITISSRIMRLANSMSAMTKRAIGLTAAGAALLVILLAVVAMWPETSEQGLHHSAPTIAAPSPPTLSPQQAGQPIVGANTPEIQLAENSRTALNNRERQPIGPPALLSDDVDSASQKGPLETDQALLVAQEKQSGPESVGDPGVQTPVEATESGNNQHVAKKNTQLSQHPEEYNPLQDPNLKASRQFDQERFDALQTQFQQEQFAALDAKQASGTLTGKRIGGGSPRIKVGQPDVTIRIWRQFGTSVEVQVLVNDSPTGRGYSIGKQPVDIPVHLQSGPNSIRLVSQGTSIVEGFQVQVGSTPVQSVSTGNREADILILEY